MSAKLFIPASNRNQGPILEVLKAVIPEKFGTEDVSVLEVGSGTGQHAAFFTKEMPQLKWQPSDINEEYIRSIQAYISEENLSFVKKPLHFDVSQESNESDQKLDNQYDMVVAVNLVHISPWTCTEGLFRTCGKYLRPGGILLTYGAYSFNGEIFPESNVSFNRSLIEENPEWGLRDVADLEKEAKKSHLILDAMFDMPSNNKTLIWCKQ